jgi:hypothetical protein
VATSINLEAQIALLAVPRLLCASARGSHADRRDKRKI